MRWHFWLNRLESSNSEASTHSLELSTQNIHNLYLFLEVSHDLKRRLAENRPFQNKCSNFAIVSLKKEISFSRFTETISYNESVIKLWLLCSARCKLLIFHVCFQSPVKAQPVWLIQRYVLMNGSLSFSENQANRILRKGRELAIIPYTSQLSEGQIYKQSMCTQTHSHTNTCMYTMAFKHKHHISYMWWSALHMVLNIYKFLQLLETYLTRNVMKSATVECCKITNIVSIWEIYNN